ncbi:MAG TPA: amino acid ABC transporter substrate-binding protein [Hyphomicrobiales bacterium]|nr:amino acid ABC transporter substrate-binding protein [Hyphomicrobiales bacterium]
MTIVRAVALATVFALASFSTAHAASTLDTVKAKGFLQCGVNTGLPGFGNPNAKGEWTGFDVDYCRAVAAAIFGDPAKVKFTPLDASQRFTALQSGEVDVLIRNTTWTMSRDTTLGLKFAGVNYYDGQGFMVRKSAGVKSVKELSGASICVQNGTDTQLNMADYFRSHHIDYKPVSFEKLTEAIAAYDGGRCDAWTTDASGLAATRLQLAKPDDHVILPEVISKEPLGPVVRQGDDQWFNIVKWTHYALLDAEELGVTKANVDEMKSSTNPSIRRLLGVEGNFGKALGLRQDWAYGVIKAMGNYGEIFEKNLGMSSPLKIKRGLNALWTQGGLQYGMPIL